jgi:hypothetical protein
MISSIVISTSRYITISSMKERMNRASSSKEMRPVFNAGRLGIGESKRLAATHLLHLKAEQKKSRPTEDIGVQKQAEKEGKVIRTVCRDVR